MYKKTKIISKILHALFALLISTNLCAQIQKIEPPNWWINMQNKQLELLVYGDNINSYLPKIDSKEIRLSEVKKTSNSNYLFLSLDISKAKAGNFNIYFYKNKVLKTSYTYQLKERKKNSQNRVGFNSSDAIYLITPDRFSNGNINNDIIPHLLENKINRNDDYARHGGDLQGITNHIDYIADLGFTSIWITPVLLNNMPKWSYHGYAITDLYKVDPRFGTLKEYKTLSKKAKEKGIKLIMDQVVNHIGLRHWWMKDLPDSNWINHQHIFENNQKIPISNHRRTTNQDIYASKIDKKSNSNGWFVKEMPDLNQKHPLLANYLIQNSIWWIETLDLGGIRQDTYPYPDKKFMSKWAKAIMKEYPNFNIVGEEWSYNPLIVSYWQKGNNNTDGYKSNLPSVMDFPMQKAIVEALNEEESWDKGLIKIYEGLANDFAYANPKNMMIFADNHDMSRIFTQLKGDIINTKMALGYLFVLPRIPQMYYGTEILLDDFSKPGDHGLIRTDFPGGWTGDAKNAFTQKNLSKDEKEMQLFVKKILNYRKNSKAIHEGKTIHFAPKNKTYFLFRTFKDETVVYIINKNKKPIEIDLKRFSEVNLNGKVLKNIISGKKLVWKNKITLQKKGNMILTTKN